VLGQTIAFSSWLNLLDVHSQWIALNLLYSLKSIAVYFLLDITSLLPLSLYFGTLILELFKRFSRNSRGLVLLVVCIETNWNVTLFD